MRSTLLLVPVLLIAAACAERGEGPATRAEESLARDLSGRTAGEPRSCVLASSGRSLVVRNPGTLVVDEGRTLWINRLDGPCPGLGPFATLEVQTHGGQYCRGDRVRGREPGQAIPGPWCVLRDFTPYRVP
jgi:hypothetical protein